MNRQMASPTANATALRRTMLQQLRTGKALLALAQQSERAIIAGDTVALDLLEPRQRALLETQVAEENERRRLAAELATRLGLDAAAPLVYILSRMAPVESSPLEQLRSQILETERAMEAQNRSNALLLENALGFVKFGLNALTSAALKPARYGVNFAQLAAPSFYIDSKA